MSTWTVAGPLLGVLVGTLIGGGFSVAVAHKNHADTRARGLADLRREEYFAALDAVAGMHVSLRDIRVAVAGRWEPEPGDVTPEAEEMRRRDLDAATALAGIDEITSDLERIALRIKAVGSPRVSDEIDRLKERVIQWFVESAESPMFSGEQFERLDVDVSRISDDLARAIRTDLDVDRFSPRR